MYSHDDSSLGAQNISSVLFILAVIIVYVSPSLLFYYYYSVPALLFFPFSLTSFFTEMSFVFL